MDMINELALAVELSEALGVAIAIENDGLHVHTQAPKKAKAKKMSKLDKELARYREVSMEEWVKYCGDWATNAFPWDLIQQGHSYHIFVTKMDGRYYVSAEEHDIRDIDQPKNGFKLLREAKAHAVEFAYEFYSAWLENNEIA